MASSRYPVPAGQHRAETVEKKSRFIAAVRRVQNPEEAKAFADAVREEFPDARHHCWAYAAGPPGSTHPCGMSDDGEPHGTAGRPMLQILQHCGIGEIMVVVTRYFGGIKLGTGGLVRAYSGAVQAALETLPTEDAVEKQRITIQTAFEHEQPIRHQLERMKLAVQAVEYQAAVLIRVEVPTDELHAFKEQLTRSLPFGAFELTTD